MVNPRDLRRTPERDTKAIYRAIAKGSVSELKKLIDAGMSLYIIYQRTCPILECLKHNRLRLAKMLIRAGADINFLAMKRMTLIFAAVMYKNVRFLSLFIQNGLSVNSKDSDGRIPLHHAARIPGGETCMKCLISYKAKIDVKDRFGLTPLHYAIKSGSPEKVMILLKQIKDPLQIIYKDIILGVTKSPSNSIRNMADVFINFGFRIPYEWKKDGHFVEFAVGTNSWRLLQYLCIAHSNSKDFYLFCEHAVRESEYPLTQEILMNFRHQYRGDKWLIEDAAICDDAATMEKFILRGEGLEKMNVLIPLAVVESSCRVLEFLMHCVHSRFNVNSEFGGKYLIHLAAEQNAWETFKLLYKFGVHIDTFNESGCTPLHVACKNRDFDSIKKLLQLGSDINLLNNEGWTPPELLDMDRDTEACAYMRKHILGLHLAGFFISDENLSFMESDHNDEFFLELKDEVEALKNTRIAGTTVSYYTLLRSSEAKLDKLLNNELIAGFIDSEIEHQFPHFAYLIFLQLENGMRRKEFRKHFVEKKFIFSQLPYLCLDNILSFISTEDLGMMSGYYPCRVQYPCPDPEISHLSTMIREYERILD